MGDVTLDGKVNIRDATAIQKHLAKIKLLSNEALVLADFDQNEKLNIKDATTIQKFIAGIIDDGNHAHSYKGTIISPTCTTKGYTLYSCSCGETYKDNWIDAKHSFSNKKCTICGITAFDYYVSWIKENGTVFADRYEYAYKSVSELEGCENLTVFVCYYPAEIDIREHITMDLYNANYRDITSLSIFEEDKEAWYGYALADKDVHAYGYIDTETYTLDSPISPYECEPGTMTYLGFVEQARESIKLTLISHLYGMDTENVGVNLIDLGFFTENTNTNQSATTPTKESETTLPQSEKPISTEPNNNYTETDPILNCRDFPLHLYSNDGKVYLGKLVTNQYDSDSIWNEYGEYGSKYKTNSIWNEYGTYGSKYNTKSAFNLYTSTPPIIVTNSGTKIGYLTANEYLINGYTITELERTLKLAGQ